MPAACDARPYNVSQSAPLPADAAEGFAATTTDRLQPYREHIAENLARSLMLVTALHSRIGYDNAVNIGKVTVAPDIALKQAAAKLGLVRLEEFDRWVVPAAVTVPVAILEGGGG